MQSIFGIVRMRRRCAQAIILRETSIGAPVGPPTSRGRRTRVRVRRHRNRIRERGGALGPSHRKLVEEDSSDDGGPLEERASTDRTAGCDTDVPTGSPSTETEATPPRGSRRPRARTWSIEESPQLRH